MRWGQLLRYDTGMGNTVIIWSQVCMGTGTGLDFCTQGNTVPVSIVLQVFPHHENHFGPEVFPG
jgi:hypothetical protein